MPPKPHMSETGNLITTYAILVLLLIALWALYAGFQ